MKLVLARHGHSERDWGLVQRCHLGCYSQRRRSGLVCEGVGPAGVQAVLSSLLFFRGEVVNGGFGLVLDGSEVSCALSSHHVAFAGVCS